MNNKIDLNPPRLCEVDGIMVYDHSIHTSLLNTIFTQEIYYELYIKLYSISNWEINNLKHNINEIIDGQ